MPVLPALQGAYNDMLKMGEMPESLSTADARRWMHDRMDETFGALSVQRPPLSETDHQVGEITVRVYRPTTEGTLPCYLYFHGGAFWLGTLEQTDSACRGYATDGGCVVVAPDYRLAPEYKFPTAAQDCYDTLLWVVDRADELGIDVDHIAVGGMSAGANLAAVVSLMARDRRGPRLVLQVLEIGVFDLRDRHNGPYLADPEDADHPYASPLLAPDLSGLPPAVVTSAEMDPLSHQDVAYAQRLREADVPVEDRCWEGQFHGSMNLAKLIPEEASAYYESIVTALRQAW